MTQEEINEGNKLIAEFMGGKFYDEYMGDLKCWKGGEDSIRHLLDNAAYLEFNCCWKWLMPVVQKIMRTAKVEIGNTVYSKYCKIYNARYDFPSTEGDSIIIVTYSAVVKFIKWHNSQSNP